MGPVAGGGYNHAILLTRLDGEGEWAGQSLGRFNRSLYESRFLRDCAAISVSEAHYTG